MAEAENYRMRGMSDLMPLTINTTLLMDELIMHDISLREYVLLVCLYTKDYYNLYRFVYDVCQKVDKDGKPINDMDITYNDKTLSVNRSSFQVAELDKLVKKGWLKETSYRKDYGTDRNILITDCFDIPDEMAEKLTVNAEMASKEVYENYPRWMEINGKKVSTLTVSYDDFHRLYCQYIGATSYLYTVNQTVRNKGVRIVGTTTKVLNRGFLPRHKRVMQGLAKYVNLCEKGEVNLMGIDKFINNRVCETILDLDDGVPTLVFN